MSRKRPELMIVNGALAGKRYVVKDGGLRFGRSSSNDVHIPDGELSRNHCLFEAVGEQGIRVTDLASANGTYLNGVALGSDPETLTEGDVVEMGRTKVMVTADGSKAPGQVDLGLGTTAGEETSPVAGEPQQVVRKRSPLANLLWVVVGLALIAAGAVVYLAKVENAEPEKVTSVSSEPEQAISEMCYEKVEADSKGIFRFELKLSGDGVLSVSLDDVPGEERHLTKSQPLSDSARATLNDILAYSALREVDREYIGVEPDPPALQSWQLRVVYTSRTRSVKVVNISEPEAFRRIREKLEAFSKNELGIWAIQYSREKVIELSRASIALGLEKWEDRDVHLGNLWASVTAYNEAIFYLETVNPKPDFAKEAEDGLRRAKEELESRYKERRFLADRAINLKHWEEAKQELRALIEMVPDRGDDRNREASAKLIDVEKRIKKGGM